MGYTNGAGGCSASLSTTQVKKNKKTQKTLSFLEGVKLKVGRFWRISLLFVSFGCAHFSACLCVREIIKSQERAFPQRKLLIMMKPFGSSTINTCNALLQQLQVSLSLSASCFSFPIFLEGFCAIFIFGELVYSCLIWSGFSFVMLCMKLGFFLCSSFSVCVLANTRRCAVVCKLCVLKTHWTWHHNFLVLIASYWCLLTLSFVRAANMEWNWGDWSG